MVKLGLTGGNQGSEILAEYKLVVGPEMYEENFGQV